MTMTSEITVVQQSARQRLEVVLLPDAGWYASPDEPGHERFWNGTTWDAASRPARRPGTFITRALSRLRLRG